MVDRINVVVAIRFRGVGAARHEVAILAKRIRRSIRCVAMIGRRSEIALVGAVDQLLVSARTVIDRVHEVGGLPWGVGPFHMFFVIIRNRVVVVIVADSIVMCHSPTLARQAQPQKGSAQQLSVDIDIRSAIK